MKFLIAAPRFHTNLYYRAKALQDAGHTVKVVVLYKGKSEFYEDIDFRQVELSFFSKLILKTGSFFNKTRIKSKLELRMQSPSNEFKKIIKSYTPDVILLKAYQNAMAIKTLITAKKYRIKVLMLTQTTHTHIKGSEFLFKLNIRLFNFLKVHAYITPVKSNYDAFKNFGIKNIFYLPFVFPLATNTNKPKSENKTNVKILSIGKFVKRKDHLLLIKTIEQLLSESHNFELNIFGEIADKKYYRELVAYVKSHNLNHKIHIRSHLTYKEILQEYNRHDVFILPAYAEPAAYSPVEAMAHGLPVICSDENGTKCYIKNGKNGYVFKAKNKDSLTEKIIKTTNRESLKKMSEDTCRMFKKNHLPQKFASSIINICK